MLRLGLLFAYRIFRRFPVRWRFFWIPLFAAGGQIVLLEFVYSTHPENIFSPDSASYIQTAKALVNTGHFAKSPEQRDSPQLARTPGYPFFLACFFWLFDECYALIVVAQILLSACTIFLAELIAWRLWKDQTIALLSALFLAIDIPSTIASQQILTETLFTFFFVLSLGIGSEALKKPSSAWRLSAFGVVFALATLIRPIAYYLSIPISILVLRSFRGEVAQRRWRTALIGMIALTLPWFVLIGGWHLRNFFVAGTTEFSTIQSINLLFYRGADIIARRDGISFNAACEQLGYGRYAEIHPETTGWTEAQLARRWKQEGLELMRRYPLLALKGQVKGLMALLFGPGVRTFFDYTGWKNKALLYWSVLAILFGYLFILYGGIMTGIWRGRRTCKRVWRMDSRHLLLGLATMYMLVVSSGPEAYSRFRIPIMPILSLYAAHGILFWPTLANRMKRRLWQDAGIAVRSRV